MVDGRAGEDADCPTRSPGEAGEGRMFDWRHLTIPPPPALLDNFWWADQWCFLHDVSPRLAVSRSVPGARATARTIVVVSRVVMLRRSFVGGRPRKKHR